jgi:hypothetical protein
MLLASARFARAQGASENATPSDAPKTPVIEPLPEVAPPAASPPARMPPALSLAQPQMIHQRRNGLLRAGEVVFGLSYGVALLGSLVLWTSKIGLDPEDGPCGPICNKLAVSMLIPVAGPLIAYTQVQKGGNPGPLLLFAGVWSGVEAAGLAMFIVGVIGHDVPQETIVTVRHTRISVVPFVTPGGGMLALRTPW